jgi:hypothetical protein
MVGDAIDLKLGNQDEQLGGEDGGEKDDKKDGYKSSSKEEESEDETSGKKQNLQKRNEADLELHKDELVVGVEEITELTVPGLNLKLQRCAITADCDLFGEPSFDFTFFRSKDLHLYYGTYFKNQAIEVVIGDCFGLISESDNEIKIPSLFLFASHCTDTDKLNFYFINQDYWRNREEKNQFKYESVTMVTQNKEWTKGNTFITWYIIKIHLTLN